MHCHTLKKEVMPEIQAKPDILNTCVRIPRGPTRTKRTETDQEIADQEYVKHKTLIENPFPLHLLLRYKLSKPLPIAVEKL